MLSTNFVDGAPVWVDLGVPDVARAAGFYGSVFGWTFESAGPEAGGHDAQARRGCVRRRAQRFEHLFVAGQAGDGCVVEKQDCVGGDGREKSYGDQDPLVPVARG